MHSRSRNLVTYALVLVIVLSLLSAGPVAIVKPLFADPGCPPKAGFGTYWGNSVQTTVYTPSNSWVPTPLTVSGFDDCNAGSQNHPTLYEWVMLWAQACVALQDWPSGPFQPFIDVNEAEQAVNNAENPPIMSVQAQLNGWNAWSETFTSPLLNQGINSNGVRTTNWCVTVTEVFRPEGFGPKIGGSENPPCAAGAFCSTIFLPFTIVNPNTSSTSSFSWSFTSLMWSTTTTTGAWISIPSVFHTLTWTASSSQASSSGAASSFTYVFQTLSMPGSAGVSTDWAVLSVSLIPATPQEGDQVMFGMQMAALSSSGAFPQSIDVECRVDGMSCGGDSVSYPGPGGVPATVTASTPWTATPGTHTLTWSVSTANDPNPNNNAVSTTFTVGSPAQTTLASTTTTPVVTGTTVSLQTSASATSTATSPNLGVVITVNQATSASPLTQTGSSPLGPLSQTDLLLVGAIVVLIALIGVIMLRRRKPSSLAIGQGTAANLIYCEQCGSQSPSTKQFCEKCGAKLKP